MAKQKETPAPQEGESAQQVEQLKELHKPSDPAPPEPKLEAPAPREGTMHVLSALQHVQLRFSQEGLAKSRNNAQQNYKFRGIDDVYNSLSTFLTEAGLVIVPRVLNQHSVERQSKQGAPLIYSHVMVEYDFYSSVDGSKITAGPIAGEAMDSADKSTNKAMSAAYKYLCLQTFCIPTEGDNDADATTHQLANKQQPKRDDTDQPPVHQQQQPKQSSAPQRQAQPNRQQPAKATVDVHVKAIMQAETEDDLKKAFGLAWKQYENPNDPKVTTPPQTKFKQKYDERREQLGLTGNTTGNAEPQPQQRSDEPPATSEFDEAFDPEAQQ